MTAADVRTGAVRAYEPTMAEQWDDLVARSVNGTFQHTRRFLAYHGERFCDRSLLVTTAKGRLAGVLPAAQDPADPSLVTSHPGLTYGGLIHDGSLSGGAMIGALELIAAEYAAWGFRALRYKPVPYIYRTAPSADDLYALYRLGALRQGCDLAAVIDLAHRGRVRADRRRCAARAQAMGVSTTENWSEIGRFWDVLERNLALRHGAAPTHSAAEMDDLHGRFGDQIALVAAQMDGAVVAGSVYFHAGPVFHQQYAASSEQGRAIDAADLVVERSVDLAVARGCRYLSFGTSTFERGRSLNESQYWFKTSFGAGGVTHEHFDLAL